MVNESSKKQENLKAATGCKVYQISDWMGKLVKHQKLQKNVSLLKL